jgi:hypothetical protein
MKYHWRSFVGAGGHGRPAVTDWTDDKSTKGAPTQGGVETRPRNVAVYFYIKIN